MKTIYLYLFRFIDFNSDPKYISVAFPKSYYIALIRLANGPLTSHLAKYFHYLGKELYWPTLTERRCPILVEFDTIRLLFLYRITEIYRRMYLPSDPTGQERRRPTTRATSTYDKIDVGRSLTPFFCFGTSDPTIIFIQQTSIIKFYTNFNRNLMEICPDVSYLDV